MSSASPNNQTELEAAAFRRLLQHLRDHPEVQNIDMMDLTGFCRNCLGRWYHEAAVEQGIELDSEEARNHIYGMPYAEWKEKYQTEADPARIAEVHARSNHSDKGS